MPIDISSETEQLGTQKWMWMVQMMFLFKQVIFMFLFVICFRGCKWDPFWAGDPLCELVSYNDPLRRLIGEEHVFHFATLCVGILCVCLDWWFGILNVASSSCSKLRHQLQVVELCWKATSYNIHRATWYCCSTMFLTPDLVQPQLAGCVSINLYNRSNH